MVSCNLLRAQQNKTCRKMALWLEAHLRDQLSVLQRGGWNDTGKRVMFMFRRHGAGTKQDLLPLSSYFYAGELWLKWTQPPWWAVDTLIIFPNFFLIPASFPSTVDTSSWKKLKPSGVNSHSLFVLTPSILIFHLDLGKRLRSPYPMSSWSVPSLLVHSFTTTSTETGWPLLLLSS